MATNRKFSEEAASPTTANEQGFVDALTVYFDEVITAAGARLSALAAVISSLAGIGGEPLDVATDADMWEETEDLVMITVASMVSAWVPQVPPETPASGDALYLNTATGDMDFNGAKCWSAELVITTGGLTDIDFANFAGVSNIPRRIRIKANNSDDINVTATGLDGGLGYTEGFGTGVVISDGTWQTFIVCLDSDNKIVLTRATSSDT